VIIEVTRNCNLRCPVCYADSGNVRTRDPDLDVISSWYESVAANGRNFNLQLSGGEPTTRDDLPEIVALGRALGFPFIQINTNGIRLGRDQDYLADLKKAGLSSVFLQFDATEDEVFLKIRGRPLLEDKQRAVEACGKHDIGVVLVPTIVPGMNDRNVGKILTQALKWSPVVRGVHFQPVSYFGRYPHRPMDEERMTLPDLMRAIEKQTEGRFRVSDFRPPGCENALCSFHGTYLVLSDGNVKSLQQPFDKTCCPGTESAEHGATQAISYVARQWSAPPSSLQGRDTSGCCSPASTFCCSTDLISLDEFVSRARTHTFSVSAMAFQDAWTLDLERVRDCCIHVFSPERGLVPFCLYNLTDANNRPLYRC